MHALSLETQKGEEAPTLRQLLYQLDEQIATAIGILKAVKEETLAEPRGVGRKQIPTTLIGLYVHSAEHSMRHIGQLLVTVKMLKSASTKKE